jgi:hypothetical protein
VSDGDVAVSRELTQGPLRFLPRPVRDPSRPWLSIPVAWATAFFPSIVLAWIISKVVPGAETPDFGSLPPAMIIFAVVIFAPLVETLIMGTVLLLLLRFVRPTVAVLISAAGWGVAHSLQIPIWGLTIWWPFLVLSTLFVAYRERSLLAAFAVPAIVHAMQNLGPAVLIASGQTN